MNGLTIKNGDTIGIVDKEIVVAAEERMDATLALISHLLKDEDKYMLSAFVGADASDEECERIREYMKTKHESVELYFIQGDQEIYPFLFVTE